MTRTAPTHEDSAQRGERIVEYATALVSTIVLVATAGALFAAVSRGLNLNDEGLYLLTARRPAEYIDNFTKAQIIWAPVLSLTGSVAGLRSVYLLMLLAAGAILGHTIATETTRHVDVSPVSHWTMVVSFAAAATAPASWLPMSPSYNGLATLAAIGIATLLIRSIAPPTSRSAVITAAALPPLLWLLFLAKWSSAAVVFLLVLFPLFRLVRSIERTQRNRIAIVVVGSVFVTLVLTHAALEPIPSILAGLKAGTAQASDLHSFSDLVDGYFEDLRGLIGHILRFAPVLFVCVLIGWLSLRSTRRRLAPSLFVLAVAASTVSAATSRAFAGGSAFSVAFGEFVPLLMALTLTVWATRRVLQTNPVSKAAISEWSVVVLTALLPIAIAVGTDNSIWSNAGIASAIWLAVMALASNRCWLDAWPTNVVVSIAACAIGIAAVSGTWVHSYRQTPLTKVSQVLTSGPAHGLRVDSATAELVDQLSTAVAPGSSLVVLWKQPGVVFAVDAIQPLDGWLRSDEQPRAARSIEEACRRSAPVAVLSEDSPLSETIQDVLDGPQCSRRQFRTTTLNVPGHAKLLLLAAPASPR